MKKFNLFAKIICLLLALILTLPLLCSCAQNKTIIGKVGEHNVFYDELYYMVSYYKASVIEEFGDNPAVVRDELDTLVRKEIISNYAFLELCADNGLHYEDIEADIDEAFEDYITSQFGGDENTFKKNCKAMGLSERYVKYKIGLELLYSRLIQVYLNSGKLLTKDSEIIDYIKVNFVHTNHLAIFNDEGDDIQKNLAKITEAEQKLASGDTIKTLIGKGYSEDFSDLDGSGYYIARNTMIPEYENAIFNGLKVGERSQIIKAHADNNLGEYVSCFYIIERFAIDEDYIVKKLDSLKNEYYQSIINGDIAAKANTLDFAPNSKYNSMDLYDLSPSADMTFAIVAVALIAVSAIITVVVIIIKMNLKKRNVSYKNKVVRRK